MPKMDILLKGVEVPEGFEATGEYRNPREGEHFISVYDGKLGLAENSYPKGPRLILRKVRTQQVGEVWRGKINKNAYALILPGGLAIGLTSEFRYYVTFQFEPSAWSFAFPSLKEWAESLKGDK